MSSLCLMLVIKMMLLIVTTNYSTSSNNLRIMSSSCVQQFHLLNRYDFGYPIKMESPMCRCDCDRNTAGKLYFQAKENHHQDCNTLKTNKTGLCFAKFQDEMNIPNCPEATGYSYCMLKLTSLEKFTAIQLKNKLNYFRILISESESIEIPVETPQFIFNQSVYKMVKNVFCQENRDSYSKYFIQNDQILKNITIWKYKVHGSKTRGDLSRPDWFVPANEEAFLHKLRHHVEFSDDICETGTTFPFYFTPKGWHLVNQTNHLHFHGDLGKKLSVREIKFDIDNVEIITDLTLNVTKSNTGFYFSGEIINGDDGFQYVVLDNCEFNTSTILFGTIKSIKSVDEEQFSLTSKNYSQLSKKYIGNQMICLYPEGLKTWKTCRIIKVNTNVIFQVPKLTTEDLIVLNNVSDIPIHSAKAFGSGKLEKKFAILIIILGVLTVIFIISMIILTVKKAKATLQELEIPVTYINGDVKSDEGSETRLLTDSIKINNNRNNVNSMYLVNDNFSSCN